MWVLLRIFFQCTLIYKIDGTFQFVNIDFITYQGFYKILSLLTEVNYNGSLKSFVKLLWECAETIRKQKKNISVEFSNNLIKFQHKVFDEFLEKHTTLERGKRGNVVNFSFV